MACSVEAISAMPGKAPIHITDRGIDTLSPQVGVAQETLVRSVHRVSITRAQENPRMTPCWWEPYASEFSMARVEGVFRIPRGPVLLGGRTRTPFASSTSDAERRIVIHKRQGHIDPDQATQEAERGFEFEGDFLILTVEPARRLRLFWRRRR